MVVLGATAWQATVGFTREATLGEAARFGLLLFQIVVYVQLLLLIFFAALSAASAVSQEKDRRTFVLLLITDMRDYEIVLGKLLGALLPITVLLLVSVPALALLMLMGGIDPSQVAQAAAVMLTTAFAAGSLGGLVALWRERTFQALALSVLFLALYLSLTQAVGAVGPMISAAADWGLVQAWIDPFLALRRAEGQGVRAAVRRADGTAARSLFLRDQAELAARQRRGGARTRGTRRALLRHGGQLFDLAAHRRACARDRRDECEPHAAVQHRDAGLGRRTARGPQRAAGAAARGEGQRCGVWDDGDCDIGGGDPHPGRGRRSAGGADRPGVLCAGDDEGNLRHRMLCAAQYRQ
jgi:hypothetical protein